MKIVVCVALLFVVMIYGCGDKKDTAAALPVKSNPAVDKEIALQAINACREARKIGGSIVSAQDGNALILAAIKGCEDYLLGFPSGEFKNEANLILVEAKRWYEYYDGQAVFEEYVEKNDLDAASEQLERIRGVISKEKYAGYKKLIDDYFKQVAMEQIESRMPGLSEYAKKLRLNFGERISYDSDFAEELIETLYLDCKSRDGRILPMANILHARLASLNSEKIHLEIEVETRGEDVRVHDRLIDSGGKLVHTSIAYEINKWGDIRPINHRLEAVYNACFSGWGEIWVIPKK